MDLKGLIAIDLKQTHKGGKNFYEIMDAILFEFRQKTPFKNDNNRIKILNRIVYDEAGGFMIVGQFVLDYFNVVGMPHTSVRNDGSVMVIFEKETQ